MAAQPGDASGGTDALTGCRSRGQLGGRLAAAIEEADATGADCSLFVFDADYFKSVNDAYGHARGDEVLASIVARVNEVVREHDELFRYGGDEFVLVLPRTTRAQAVDIGHRVVQAVQASPLPGEPPLSVSISLGVATYPAEATDGASLMAAADRRNYLAKQRGRAQAVADDAATDGPAESSSRLLERHTALNATQAFLSRLAKERRGTLRVAGPPGAGHTRFLTEVVRMARLRGFTVRTGVDFDAAEFVGTAEPVGTPTAGAGVLIVLDSRDSVVLDEARALLRAAPRDLVLGLVHATTGPQPADEAAGDVPPFGTRVELTPWTTAALQTWLRTRLRGEPQPPLVDWLDGHSGGLPALAERELSRLTERAALERTATGGWTLTAATLAEADRRAARRNGIQEPTVGGCQLPPHIPDFVGRDAELVGLVSLARDVAAGRFPTAPVASIYGHPGAGKTTMAVHLAHTLAEYFPDGQWYLDLRGADDRPLEPADALGRVLTALGVPADRMPADPAERSALYRSLTHDRRLLVVLDNAHNEAQVRPLLPAGPTFLVFVTSRRSLGGLAGARRLCVDMLSPEGSVDLLAQIVGRDRVMAEPAAAFEVARLCGGLPLALRIAGNRLASRPNWSIEHLAVRLRDDQRRLDVLTAGDLQLSSAFALSYGQLTDRARAGFRRLSLAPGPDFDATFAGVLLGSDAFDADDLVEELVDVSLIEPAPTPGRYRFHDLLRIFAGDRLAHDEDADAARAIEERVLRWLLDAASRAGLLIGPDDERCPQPGPPGPGDVTFDGEDEAIAWLDAEWGNWIGALRRAATLGFHAEVLRTAWAMHWYSDRRFHRSEWKDVFTLGLQAARALGDRWAECILLDFVAWALTQGDGDSAEPLLREVLDLAREVGNRTEEGWALVYLGNCAVRADRPEAAITWYEQSYQVFRELDFPTGSFVALSHLGHAYRVAGHPGDCLRYQEQALDLVQRAGLSLAAGLATTRMAEALASMDLPAEACRRYEQAIGRYREVGHTAEVAECLSALAPLQAELGQVDDAVRSLEEAAQIFSEIRDLRHQALTLQALGRLVKDRREHGAALAYEQRAAAILATLDGPAFHATV